MTDYADAIREAREAALRRLDELDAQIVALREERNRLYDEMAMAMGETKVALGSMRKTQKARGGVRQRSVIEALEKGPMTTTEVAAEVFSDVGPRASNQPQASRILAALRDKGIVTKIGGLQGKWRLVR